jgi:hypothetical protein
MTGVEEDDLVARSLEQVAERFGDPAAEIYRRAFQAFPDAEAMFWRDTTGAVRGEMLAMAFKCLLELDGPFEANLLKAERVNHEGFGVAPDAFAGFFPIVRDVCRDLLGADWTPDVEAAWNQRLGRLSVLTA